MKPHYLSKLFLPQSVAVIGANDRVDSVGGMVFRNMLENGFKGRLYAINQTHSIVQGKSAYQSIEQIKTPVDLAVICTPANTVPDIIEACGKHGVPAAVVLSAGFSEIGKLGVEIEQLMLAKAKTYGMRILGPNCLGLIYTANGVNATFFNGQVKSGNLALVSQSGALCTAILDYAPAHDIGFSTVVSMGSSADIDFGEILDYLAIDARTESILIYIEGIHKAREFLSSLRAVARNKPVFVIKAGRHAAGSKAATSHTGALVGADDVFDSALRRAGAVRVRSIGGLFSAAQTLAANRHFIGNRLAIITNGGGPGVMAIDRAEDLGVAVAEFSEQTMAALNQALPVTWSHHNPVDIIGDATAARFVEATSICMRDAGVDGVLVILTPQAMTQPLEVAQAMIVLAAKFDKPLLTCWMGHVQIGAAREAFVSASVPTFRTPEAAIEAFSYITNIYRNQQQLAQIPGPLSHQDAPDVAGARLLIESVLAEKRNILTETESKALLAAFRIPVATTAVARSAGEAVLLAEEMGFPVAIKVNSKQITHKSDTGGVRLNLMHAQSVYAAYQEVISHVQSLLPNAVIDGVSVEPMVVKPNGRELMIGVTTDAVFGPVITFGAGGVMVEVMGDRAVALPPVNSFLVKELIAGTRISKLLGSFRNMPPINMEALESVLLRVSEMVCELPWLKEMDINPLIIDEKGAMAVDARVIVDFAPASRNRYAHMAISPYPVHLINEWQMADGTMVTIRPIRPEDARLEQDFFQTLSETSRYFRFMHIQKELPVSMLVRLTQIDYDREMALIALVQQAGKDQEIGVCRYVINPDRVTCEFALAVSDEWQHKAVGHKLMNSLIEVARDKGLQFMEGLVLASNLETIGLVTSLGFKIEVAEGDLTLRKVSKDLHSNITQ